MGPIGYAFVAALSYGTADFLGGRAATRIDAMRVVAWSQAIGLAVALVLAPVVGGTPSVTDLWLGAAAGVAGVLGLVSLYRGLASGRAAVVAPASGVVGALVPALIGLIAGERPGGTALAGFVVSIVAVWLASGGRAEPGSGLGLGLLAGIGFGLFFVALAPVPETAGLWPLVPTRIASIVVLAVLLRGRVGVVSEARTRLLVVGAGAGDMAANVAILIALQTGPLGEGAVVSSLYPVVTVLWAAIVIRERIRPSQWAGVAAAVVGMSLIAA